MSALLRTTLLLTAAVVLALAAASVPANAKEKENPILAQVKASLKDPSRPFTLIVRLQLKEGSGPKLAAAFAKARADTRKEKGNLAYDLNRSAKAANEYLIYERWQNLAALETHMQAAYFTALLSEVHDMLAGPPDFQVYIPAGH